MIDIIGKLASVAVPPWARWIAILGLAAAAGGWCWLKGDAHRQTIDDVRIARIEADHAQALTRIAQTGAAAAQRTAAITVAQATATQETDHAAATQRATLDARIAAGGLRIHTACPAPAGGRAVPAIPGTAGIAHADSGQSMPAPGDGDPGALPPYMAPAVLTAAARDAQRQLQLMDWIEGEREALQPTNGR